MGLHGTLGTGPGPGVLPTKYGVTGIFENWDKISAASLGDKYLLKRRGCYACTIGCGRYVEVPYGPYRTPPHEGSEYEPTCLFGSWCYHDNLEAILRARIPLQHLRFRYNIHGKYGGVLDGTVLEGDYNRHRYGWVETWGNSEAIIALIHKIAQREGLGNIPAEGVRSAAVKIGKGASKIAIHAKGLEMPAHEPRGESKIFAVQYAVNNRGGCHINPQYSAIWNFGLDAGLKPHGLPDPPAQALDEEGVGIGCI